MASQISDYCCQSNEWLGEWVIGVMSQSTKGAVLSLGYQGGPCATGQHMKDESSEDHFEEKQGNLPLVKAWTLYLSIEGQW